MQSSLFFESLFKRPANDSNVDFIKQLAAEHPYFSPAQFYVLQQTPVYSEAYTQQAAKTAALFNNPYWLNFQLLRMQQASELNETIDTAEEIHIQQPAQINETTEPLEAVVETPTQESLQTTEAIEPAEEEQILQPAQAIEPYANIEEVQVQQAAEATKIIAPVEEEQEPAEIINTEHSIVEEEKHTVVENTSMEETSIKPLEEKIPGIQYPANVDEKLLFEPLFARDYFASQGIKISEEILTNDKLGKQLKSFTDWLKTMKKITPDKMQIDHSQQNDSAIQTLAAKSNAEGETITETMADIFMQQGKADKAIETYEKLSLLNPVKSAYFAAKIEQLKEH